MEYKMTRKLLTEADKKEITDIEFDGIDHTDYPDYCDAYITYATLYDRELTDEEIDELNEDSSFVYECLMEYLH